MTSGWRIAGAYFEACNCEAVCPCRMIAGVPGGRSTYGQCYGALSWAIEEGRAGGVDLDGMAAALVYRYDDDEAGSPWSFALHVDERANHAQRSTLVDIFTGARGGEAIQRQPWVRKPSTLVGVRSSRIEIAAEGSARTLRVGERIEIAANEVVDPENARCIVPGYDEPGVELRARTHRVDDDPFAWSLSGRCAFAARFDYSGAAPG